MLLTQEDFEELTQAQLIIAKVLKNAALSEIEENHERDISKRLLFLKPKICNGVQQSIPNKTIMEELKEMLIELKIKGSIRERTNGLIELRTQAFGSIYGRTKDEIESKLSKKIKGSNNAKKKFSVPLLSEFFLNSYLPYKKNQNRAESTIKDIESKFNYIIEQGFDKPLSAYKAQEIEKFLFSIPETRKRQILQGLFNNIFKRAVTEGIIKINPCDNIEKMQHTKKQGTAFSFDEQLQFFSALFKNNNLTNEQKKYFIFVYLTGTRRNEALDVKFSDVDFKNKVLTIHGTKTSSSERQIPLTSLVEKLLLSITPIKGAFFPFSERNIEALFHNVKDEIQLNHKLHDLRHTFGTIQICCEKVDIKTVSLWMGHSTVDTTLKIYTHPEQLDKGCFLRGDLTEKQKTEIYRFKYKNILNLINDFI